MMQVCTNLLCTGAVHAINTIMYSYVSRLVILSLKIKGTDLEYIRDVLGYNTDLISDVPRF